MADEQTRTLHHTCFVVRDIEKAARALAESLGIRPWSVWTIEPESGTVHGKDARYSFRVAMASIGGSSYELISPHAGDSVYVEHLASRGEGFHHTCIRYPTRETYDAAKAGLAGQGREMIQSGVLGELGEFCYFWMPETGAPVELMYLAELPPPDRTID